jgi:hypothetical protein
MPFQMRTLGFFYGKTFCCHININSYFLNSNTQSICAGILCRFFCCAYETQRGKSNHSRVIILKEYLEQYNSPLAVHAETFVKTADKYNLDWKFVAAISGLESTFGREIPYNSFNGWGWGIFGDNMIRFSSWDEGIETVSEGLRNKYMNRWGAQDVYSIGKLYASSPTWAQRVTYFMDSIEKFKDAKLATNLSISL